MIDKAIAKIKAEMEADKSGYAQVIGKYLLQQIEINKGAADKIVNEGKSIKGSIQEMSKEAKKNAKNGCGVLTDAEGFAIVAKYFGFEAVQDKILEVVVNEIKETNDIKSEEVSKKDVSFDVNLEDILGGL